MEKKAHKALQLKEVYTTIALHHSVLMLDQLDI